MCYSIQIKLQLWFEHIFSYWADIVSKRTTCIFLTSLVIQLVLSFGFVFMQSYYKEQNLLWTPQDNQTYRNKERAKAFFGEEDEFRQVNIIVEAKGDNLLTIDAFEEMIQFEKILYSVSEQADTHLNAFNDVVRSGDGDVFKFEDICMEFQLATKFKTFNRCQTSPMPLDFIYDKSENSYQLDKYKSDAELLAKIQTGKGDPTLYEGTNFLFVDNIFAETVPLSVEQQEQINNPLRPIGQNNLEKAKYAQFEYYIATARFKGINEDAYLGWEENLQKAVSEWTQTTQAIRVIMFTQFGFIEAWSADVKSEAGAIWYASLAVFIYLVFFLGACSPIFCRAVVAFTGAISILFSFTSGFGLLFYCGYQISSFHGTIPFLMMSIGVEQMFVITDAIDQVPKDKTAYEKVHQALSHAGPAITITTLTTASAFAFGMISSLEALRSFCLFATVCILLLYFCMMTLFLASVVWDTQRQSEFRRDCFGLFCCAESSIFCCKGIFVSQQLREHVGNVQFAIHDESKLAEQASLQISAVRPKHIKAARDAIKKRSASERCCGMCWAPVLLSNCCRIFVLLIFLVLIAAGCYGILELRVFIDQMNFVSKESDVYDWFIAQEQQFKKGTWGLTKIYIENDSIEFDRLKFQHQIHDLDYAIQNCEGCENKWHKERTLQSWYGQYWNWVSVGYCSHVQPATIPGQRIVVPEGQFYDCLNEWFDTDYGRNMQRNIKQDQDGKIIGWRELVYPIKTDDVFEDGPKYLDDMDKLFSTYGITDTYAYSDDMLTMETFKVLIREFIISSAGSCIAIFLVVLLITGAPRISLLTVFSVVLTDFFLLATIPFVNLNFNNVVVVYLITSLGLSVLYSVHISHTFLLVAAPNTLKPYKQRQVKARVALSRMGASVLHGAVVTLLFIGIVAFWQKSYFFEVFYKLWLGIVIFGCVNAFILIPVLLSLSGPTPNYVKKALARRKSFLKRLSSLSPMQLRAMSSQYNFDQGDPQQLTDDALKATGHIVDQEIQTQNDFPPVQDEVQYAVDQVSKDKQHWLMSKMAELFFKANTNSAEMSQLSPAQVSEADSADEVSNPNIEETKDGKLVKSGSKKSTNSKKSSKSNKSGKSSKSAKGKKGAKKGISAAAAKKKKGISNTSVKKVPKKEKWFSQNSGVSAQDDSKVELGLGAIEKLASLDGPDDKYKDNAIDFQNQLGSGLLLNSEEDNSAFDMNMPANDSARQMLNPPQKAESDLTRLKQGILTHQVSDPMTEHNAVLLPIEGLDKYLKTPSNHELSSRVMKALSDLQAKALTDLQEHNQDLTKNEAMQVIEELKQSHIDQKFDRSNSAVLSGLNISDYVNDYIKNCFSAEMDSSDGRNVNIQPTSEFPQLQITQEAFNMLGSQQKPSLDNNDQAAALAAGQPGFNQELINVRPMTSTENGGPQQQRGARTTTNHESKKIGQDDESDDEDAFKDYQDANPKAFGDTSMTFFNDKNDNEATNRQSNSEPQKESGETSEQAKDQIQPPLVKKRTKEDEDRLSIQEFAKEVVGLYLPKI